MNILFLSHRIPFPPNKGDKIRSFNELLFLAKKHKIYLGTTLDDETEEKYVERLMKYCASICTVRFDRRPKLLKAFLSSKPFSVYNFYDKRLQQFTDDVLSSEPIDAIICYCSSMAEYVFNTPRYREGLLPDTRLIMDFVDLDSDKWHQYATYSTFPLNLVYWMENRRLFKYEVKVNNAFQHSVFVSPREEKVFNRLYPRASSIRVIANGVDDEIFVPRETVYEPGHVLAHSLSSGNGSDRLPCNYGEPISNRGRGPILVFTGFMDYFANEDGVRWFCQRIFPKIRQEFPTAEFMIVGNKPTNLVWSLSELDGVTVTGYVEDIRHYYWMADVYVTPLRIARGLQNKVLEAMATGNAVVATSNASDGIICHQNEDIIIADSEEEFAHQVINLLKDHDRRRSMQKAATDNIRRHYSWERNLQALERLLEDGIED
jgi:glycosyltransferase involved in cell wall biosynthesis